MSAAARRHHTVEETLCRASLLSSRCERIRQKQDAPRPRLVQLACRRAAADIAHLEAAYCAYMRRRSWRRLPISALAASDEPVLTTTPAPSLRPHRFIEPSGHGLHRSFGTFAVTTGASLVPDASRRHVGGPDQESEVHD